MGRTQQLLLHSQDSQVAELDSSKDGEAVIIYIASPYSAPTEHARIIHTYDAMLIGYRILQRGHYPYIPHLSHFFNKYVQQVLERYLGPELYYDWGLAILERCDALLSLGPSPGADAELARAKELGLQIFYKVEEVPNASKAN